MPPLDCGIQSEYSEGSDSSPGRRTLALELQALRAGESGGSRPTAGRAADREAGKCEVEGGGAGLDEVSEAEAGEWRGPGDGPVISPMPRIIAASAGHEHTLLLDTHGRVYACGSGRHGKLGLGDAYDRHVPVRIRGLPRIAAISAGGQHSLVLSRTGAIFAFGCGEQGQLGTGESRTYFRPVCVMDTPAMVAVSAGGSHSLCLDASGCVYAFGSGGAGRLGLGDVMDRPYPESISSTCWMDASGCINEARAIPRFAAISAGLEHSLLLDHVGRVFAVGNQAAGKLGLGDEAHRFLPAQVMGLPKAFVVSAGHYHSLVLSRGVDVDYYHRQYLEAGTRLVGEEQRRFARWKDETRRRLVYMQQSAAAVHLAQAQDRPMAYPQPAQHPHYPQAVATLQQNQYLQQLQAQQQQAYPRHVHTHMAQAYTSRPTYAANLAPLAQPAHYSQYSAGTMPPHMPAGLASSLPRQPPQP